MPLKFQEGIDDRSWFLSKDSLAYLSFPYKIPLDLQICSLKTTPANQFFAWKQFEKCELLSQNEKISLAPNRIIFRRVGHPQSQRGRQGVLQAQNGEGGRTFASFENSVL